METEAVAEVINSLRGGSVADAIILGVNLAIVLAVLMLFREVFFWGTKAHKKIKGTDDGLARAEAMGRAMGREILEGLADKRQIKANQTQLVGFLQAAKDDHESIRTDVGNMRVDVAAIKAKA